MASRSARETSDGRHARSESSRARIVSAMLDLVAGGEVSPGAAQIAAAAGVGLRSVFRHFDDMDALYREMSEHIEAMVLPITLRPLQASDWRGQLHELAGRRVQVFETILPYRISASIKRFHSTFLMEDYRRMLRLERASVDAVLPPEIAGDATRAHAINAVLSFQNWRLLRHDQHLPVETASAVVRHMLDALIADA
jgi:AcrR family transcriptional regulator